MWSSQRLHGTWSILNRPKRNLPPFFSQRIRNLPVSPLLQNYKQLLSSKTVGQRSQFRSLNENTWINIAKPRIIKTGDLKRDPKKATALMKLDHIQEFIPMLSEN